jgi:Cdc6-like AAA superfamily ATPase|tara:strand:+ start:833 stop:1084 length:252 start_codon:yes stop_codon:yes gene_type:complete
MQARIVDKEYTKEESLETLEQQFETMSNMFFKAESKEAKRMLYIAFIAGCSTMSIKDYIENKYPELKDKVVLSTLLNRIEEDM